MALGIDSPARADRQDDKAHVRRENPILVSTRVSGDGEVSCKARSIGVVCSDVRRPSRVQRLDVDEQIGPRLVEISKNDIPFIHNTSTHNGHTKEKLQLAHITSRRELPIGTSGASRVLPNMEDRLRSKRSELREGRLRAAHVLPAVPVAK